MNREYNARDKSELYHIEEAMDEHDIQLISGTAASKTHTRCHISTDWIGKKLYVDSVSRLDLVVRRRLHQACGRTYSILELNELDQEIGRRVAGNELAGVQDYVRGQCFLSNHKIFETKISRRALYSTRSVDIEIGSKYDRWD